MFKRKLKLPNAKTYIQVVDKNNGKYNTDVKESNGPITFHCIVPNFFPIGI
jgi:hypothetical protein